QGSRQYLAGVRVGDAEVRRAGAAIHDLERDPARAVVVDARREVRLVAAGDAALERAEEAVLPVDGQIVLIRLVRMDVPRVGRLVAAADGVRPGVPSVVRTALEDRGGGAGVDELDVHGATGGVHVAANF